MSPRPTPAIYGKMVAWGVFVWTIVFVIAVYAVALPFVEAVVSPGFEPPAIWPAVLPTWLAGTIVIAGFLLLIRYRSPKRLWLTCLLLAAGGFVTMLPVLAFVAMPDALWQLISALGVSIALLVAKVMERPVGRRK